MTVVVCLPAAVAANASVFALMSSVRSDWHYGLSPGGLTNGYNGHSFWGQSSPAPAATAPSSRGLLADICLYPGLRVVCAVLDTEIWMLPPLLLWYPRVARSLLQYRYDRLDQAMGKAASHDPPYR